MYEESVIGLSVYEDLESGEDLVCMRTQNQVRT